MAQTGRELRKQMILTAARDYQAWENRRRFWRRVSVAAAFLSFFFLGLTAGLVIS